MILDPHTEFREILRRGKALKRKREQLTNRILAGSSAGLLAALALCIRRIGGGDGSEKGIRTAYGAFLLPRESGIYVIASVIAFALGVTVTLLCVHYRKQKEGEKDDKPPNAEG